MTMIETTNLAKRYGDLTAVDGIDLTVEAGSIHGFVGPNGAGKTTTMQMLVGLVSPTEGEALIDGAPAGSIEANATIGYSPQEPALEEGMTGRSYLHYMGKMAGLDDDLEERTEAVLAWIDMDDAADQPIGEYSGGMQRRISLAQAMIHEPDLLILDEPTAALDPSGRMAIIESLEDLTEEGVTVFVSSHVLAELEQFIDTVSILRDGTLVETGPVDDIETGGSGQAFAVETDDDDRLAALLDERSWVTEVTREDDILAVRTDQPDEFRSELQQLLADEGILLQSLQETGGLEEAFADVVGGDDGDQRAEAADDGGEQ